MPLTRQQKEERVAATEQELKAATSAVFVAFTALTVDDTEELRDRLHEQGGSLKVLPKRLMDLVLKKLALDFDPTTQEGQFAIVWGNDAVTPAKVVSTFIKKREHVRLVGGSLEGSLLSLEQVNALAALPSREELLALLLRTMNGPTQGLVMVLSGVQRQTVQVLSAIADKKQ